MWPQNEARKLNHQEVAEEDRRKKLPTNWEAMQRRVEWENKEEEARKVITLTTLTFSLPGVTNKYSCNFSLQYHNIVKQTVDENKEKTQLGDIVWFHTNFSELTLQAMCGRR